NCELKHVNVVLSPDPNVFRHSTPLAGLAEGGVFVIQSDLSPEQLWNSLPPTAQRRVREKNIKVYYVDAFKIASEEATDPEFRYRMQGAAFMGAFFKIAPFKDREALEEKRLFEGIHAQLNKKFGHLGDRVVQDNLRVIRRGYDELEELDVAHFAASDAEVGANPTMPDLLDVPNAQPGLGNPGRFWEQVCHMYQTGTDGIADPFAAVSAIPAATSTIRDMTNVRFEVPEFIPAKCTGCAQCWVQCPDAAIPGVVTEIDGVINAAITHLSNGKSFNRIKQVVPHLARESRKIMKAVEFTTFADVLKNAYDNVVQKLKLDPERRRALDEEFAPVYSALAEFPLAKTAPFFDAPESREAGTGALLSITINPEACKGCNICVEVCPDEALVAVRQEDSIVERMRRNWELWQHLPETDDRYLNVSSYEEGIGALPSLLLKKANYRSMVGGDGACMGCGEKTAAHLVFSAVNALMIPRVKKYVEHLDELIAQLDAKAREIFASDADLETLGKAARGEAEVTLEDEKRRRVERIKKTIDDLKDLRWRYTEGPSGHGRAPLGMTNATGCSSVWGSTYPYNPYPYPWVNHLFQDAPSIAIGIFEGHMRKMADGFVAVRRAELELKDEYDPDSHESFFAKFDWRQFSDEEFAMCPPIFAVGGDGAMLDIGFQNLSRLLASGKPVRVIVLDTQVYSNTGGQACTSGFLGQVSDMAAYGKGQHGKEETRKEISLVTLAHRGAYVLQASQAAPSHLMGGVLRGLQSRRPAVFVLHCPCPPEHGLGDDAANKAARLALESRAFPVLEYNPDAGKAFTDCLNLDGNPEMDEEWPTYDLRYVDEDGNEQVLTVPITTADWAATETRFRKHFLPIPEGTDEEDLVPFHEYLRLSPEEREGKGPFIYVIDDERRLSRLIPSDEMVELAEDRLLFWSQLKQLAGLEIAESVRDELESTVESTVSERYEARIAELKASYPPRIARRLAEGLIRAGNGQQTIADLLSKVTAMPDLAPLQVDVADVVPTAQVATAPAAPAPASAPAATVAAPAVEEAEGELAMEPYIESERCTTCDECTNLNRKMFAYNEKKQAFIKDPRAGTFRELVQAAEKCPVRIIHPGTPLNPKEKNLDKWVKRAEPFS
ncbi:MAG: 2-oxoacid:acceptor oxidoreductase family protein, partial [Gemmatimonadales bacterium]